MNEIGIIVTLKKVLEIYADSKNYQTTASAPSMIEMDKGEMARNVLKMIDSVEKANATIDVAAIDSETDFDTLESMIKQYKIYDQGAE